MNELIDKMAGYLNNHVSEMGSVAKFSKKSILV